MFNTTIGIEIEFTGITRSQAAEIAADYLEGIVIRTHDSYDTYQVITPDGREWQFKRDSSITCQRRVNGRKVEADSTYSVEFVSPILDYYKDINTIQELVRKLRTAGGFTTSTCGIHIHLGGHNHTTRSIRNFVNIIASKNDLFYKSLQIEPARMSYCKKLDEYMVEKMNAKKPKSLDDIADIWYAGSSQASRNSHYHMSRYHFLNLHSFFTGHKTVELRGFNGTLHAGKIRSYMVLALALNNQALTQKSASAKKPQTENEKFAMRTYLNRIGFIGNEFKNCREHLIAHLDGCAAWRFGAA